MSETWMSLLQQGMGVLLQLVVIVVLALLRGLKNHVQNYYMAHTTASQRQLLSQLGQEAFAYAETVHADGDGPAKLNQAIRYLMDAAKSNGLPDVPMTDARAVIESAWLADQRMSGTKTTSGVTQLSREP